MQFDDKWESKSYVRIPDLLLNADLKSLKAVYIYAKIMMLQGKTYAREAWVTNPCNKQKEMSIDTLSDITEKLEKAALIHKVKQNVGTQYKANRYEILPITGNYKPVYHDFINHTELSADAKGLAILLALLKDVPASDNAIANAVGYSRKTVKKYLDELIRYGIFDPDTKLLNEQCFPFYKLVRDKKAKALIDDYQQCLSIPDNQLTEAYKRQLDYVKSLPESLASQARIWRKITMGLANKSKKIDKTSSNNLPHDANCKIKPIIL